MLQYSDAIERVPSNLEEFRRNYAELDETSDLLNLFRERDRPYVEAILRHIETQGSSGQVVLRTISPKNSRMPIIIRVTPNQNKNLLTLLMKDDEIYISPAELGTFPFFHNKKKKTPMAQRFYLTKKKDTLPDTIMPSPRTIVLSLHHKDYK